MPDIIKEKKSVCLIRVKWAKNNEPPTPSKPYQVLELLPVWEETTEDDRLAHFLSYCHGNSCDQSALARADSGRPGGGDASAS